MAITKYTYDEAGNELGYTGPGNRTVKYTFDTLNRLTGVEIPGSEPVKYLYDALGRRVALAGKNGVIKERNLYSGFGRAVLAVMDGKGKIKTRYITMPGGQLLARVDSSSNKPFYYHFDALGSTVAVTDEKGKVISRSTYDPFGARISHPATDDRYGFVGNEWVKDEGNGLMQMGVRWYDPGTGRFISKDPILTFYKTPYVYSNNNPIRFIDPIGLFDTSQFIYGLGVATYGVGTATAGVSILSTAAVVGPAGGIAASWMIGIGGASIVAGGTSMIGAIVDQKCPNIMDLVKETLLGRKGNMAFDAVGVATGVNDLASLYPPRMAVGLTEVITSGASFLDSATNR